VLGIEYWVFLRRLITIKLPVPVTAELLKAGASAGKGSDCTQNVIGVFAGKN
jgi:hypothetical protein